MTKEWELLVFQTVLLVPGHDGTSASAISGLFSSIQVP